jgi:hypothetical protein
MNSSIRNAIARIELIHDGIITRRGTACLVGENIVLTSLHVIADRTATPVFFPGEIRLTFPTYSATARVLDAKWHAAEDWVLLASEGPSTANWLSVGVLAPNDHVQWETYGFPDAQPDDGMVCRGSVANHAGTLDGVTVQQLFCHEAAAGNGMPVSGLSGAPVLVNGFVVGVLRSALVASQIDPDTGLMSKANVGGTVYACPASRVAASCREYFPERLPTVSSPALPGSTTVQTFFSLLRGLNVAITTIVMSLVTTLALLVLAQIVLGWTFTPTGIALILLMVLSIMTIVTARLRSRRALKDRDGKG